jgi:interferon gamma-inducible protein 30
MVSSSSSSSSSKTLVALLLCMSVVGLAHAVRTLPRNPPAAMTDGLHHQGYDKVKVKVNYYSESLCPGCAEFGSGPFYEALFRWEPFIDLNLVVYGNEKDENGTYTCQHGPEECYMNLFENCLIYYSKEVEHLGTWDYYPFFKCADDVVVERYPNVTGISEVIVNTCATKLPPGVTPQELDSCAKSPLGQKLIGIAQDETDALVPKHTYVPWMTIEGQPIYQNLQNVSTEICVAYAALNKAHFNRDLCFPHM